MGVVLAGVFTHGALAQLKSLGFGVLYFPYESVIKAFAKYGIDVAFDEKSAEADFKKKIDSWNNLPDKSDVAKELLRLNRESVNEFLGLLSDSVSRFIDRIIILPLHGQESISSSVSDAIDFLRKYSVDKPKLPLNKYEIVIKYNTGDRIEASFKDKNDSIKFLEAYL